MEQEDRQVNLNEMRQLEYQTLKKITEIYHGARKLGWVAVVEPLQPRLDHISILWAARLFEGMERRIDIQ